MKIISIYPRILIFLLIFVCLAVFKADIAAKENNLLVSHKVGIESLGEQLFKVETKITNIDSKEIKIFFPRLRPGIYTTYYYIKYVADLEIVDKSGNKLDYSMPKNQVFMINTNGKKEVFIRFNYRADTLSASKAYLDNDLGYFTGMHFFVMINDKFEIPATIDFDLPEDWKVLTTLKFSEKDKTYYAEDYEKLADSQTVVGKFEQETFQVNGRDYVFATAPVGWYPVEKKTDLIKRLKSSIKENIEIFKDVPYEKYIFYYIFKERPVTFSPEYLPEIQSANSHLHVVRPNDTFSAPARVLPSAIHNHFHAWSLMRMRPVEYWNWDYSKNVDSSLLWLTEGVARYYTNLIKLRSKNATEQEFLQSINDSLNTIEPNQAREIYSPADASVLSSVRYEGLLEIDYSFNLGGHLLGMILDLSIRKDTENKKSLDDALRLLYEESYKQNKGYSTEDFRRVIEKVSGKSYQSFFAKYVTGTEVFPYNELLEQAGYKVERNDRQRPTLGVLLQPTENGVLVTRVLRDSVSEDAGLMREDLIIKFGNLDVVKNGLAGAGELVGKSIGKTIPLLVKRNGKNIELILEIKNVSEENYRITDLETVSATQRAFRNKWLGLE